MRISSPDSRWIESNQRYLSASLAVVSSDLEQYAAPSKGENESGEKKNLSVKALEEAAREMKGIPALSKLCQLFGLSSFERDVLLLCAGFELDSAFLSLFAGIQRDRPYPTFSIALAALQDPHWGALSPAAPLRRWRLIEVSNGSALTLSQLRIDERVLHYLTGVHHIDERLMGIIEPFHSSCDPVPTHLAIADQMAELWSNVSGKFSAVQLCGNDTSGKRDIATACCGSLGVDLIIISAGSIPSGAGELDGFIRLLGREAALSQSVLLLDCDEVDATDTAREKTITKLIDSICCGLIITSVKRQRARERAIVTFDVYKPTAGEQRKIWNDALCPDMSSLNGEIDVLVSQFDLNARSIQNVCSMVKETSSDDTTPAGLVKKLWDSCRVQSRSRLDSMAQKITPAATWGDLVLPESQNRILREIAVHVRQRARVYDTWDFASKGSRGLGISALFAGDSGTGKTMAAEVLANELCLDLYRIDLSQVVNKYIGETEKNLSRVFDAAQESGAILLFDEADALFGKRTEVRDSHDRFANIEVSYLLQRMEVYRGLAILTTNMKQALDPAFLRRIRFVMQFPFPDHSQRKEIWKRVFPENTPTEGLDVAKLSRLNMAGGNIRNIAMNAAFIAADAGTPVRMAHLLRAARSECAKTERSLTEAEIGGWV
jgi:hypothetical protein